MNLPRTVRKIRACKNEAAAQLLLENAIKEARVLLRDEIWNKIDGKIEGRVTGNGLDQMSTRNGLVRACNLVSDMEII